MTPDPHPPSNLITSFSSPSGPHSLACLRLISIPQSAVRGYDPSATPTDASSRRLFSTVAASLWERPTYRAFHALLDNYTSTTGTADVRGAGARAEEGAFLGACLATRPMRYAHAVLVSKGLAPPDPAGFNALLYSLWFAPYSRDARNDSSGFEHVFVGEVRGGAGPEAGAALGIHNWIAILAAEGAGDLDYYGYLRPRTAGAPKGAPRAAVTPADRVLSLQLAWRGAVKPVTTIFVGTSPEAELALYTLCVLSGQEETDVRLWGEFDVRVRAYRIRTKGGVRVGSAFPELIAKGAGGSSLHSNGGNGGGGYAPGGQRPNGGGGGGGRPGRPNSNGYSSGQQPGCGNILLLILREVIKRLK